MYRSPRNHRSNRHRHISWGLVFAVLLSLGLVIFGLEHLIGYGMDFMSSSFIAQELLQIYRTTPTDVPVIKHEAFSAAHEKADIFTPVPIEASTFIQKEEQIPILHLPITSYPNNPRLNILSRFSVLQKENKHIIGWLGIQNLLEEPVMQRDNIFYLNHDAQNKENVNGALFLDSAIELKNRPYTYIIYGHNMKSGAMFGSLRNYENSTFYHNAPFISFDTMYETGCYVVFSVGIISINEYDRNYIDFFSLLSTDILARQLAIETLISASVHTCTIDVQSEDQILLLVTCAEKEDDRRVIAARRIRDSENEKELKTLVKNSKKR
ncbi:MAG: class B sortase [Clostridia bacterium]|nr:class B sortase [Clostridia bacterium]